MYFQNVCIEAIGYCLPSIVMTSEKLEKMLAPLYERLGLSEGRLELMSGIHQRRFWPEGTLPSQASAMAAQVATFRTTTWASMGSPPEGTCRPVMASINCFSPP